MEEVQERKLATIRVVTDVVKHPNADRLDIVTVDGWKCITQRDEYKPGDRVVYFEVDSFLPLAPWFEFLRKSSFKSLPDGREGYRLKTIKLRGSISQGLVMPEELVRSYGYSRDLEIGQDVSEILEVTKYDPPVPTSLSGKVRGNFPSFLRKTNEERIQNLTAYWDTIKTKEWHITEKMDGTSFTAYNYEGRFGVCSRNLDLEETDDNLYWKVAKELKLNEKLPDGFAIQGEIIGPGVQKNYYGNARHQLMFFSLFDIRSHQYLSYSYLKQFVQFRLGLETRYHLVPSIGSIWRFEPGDFWSLHAQSNLRKPTTIDELITFAEGKSVINDSKEREGLVLRCEDGDFVEWSFKVISNKYLLTEKDEEVVIPVVVEEKKTLWTKVTNFLTKIRKML